MVQTAEKKIRNKVWNTYYVTKQWLNIWNFRENYKNKQLISFNLTIDPFGRQSSVVAWQTEAIITIKSIRITYLRILGICNKIIKHKYSLKNLNLIFYIYTIVNLLFVNFWSFILFFSQTLNINDFQFN